MLSKTVEYALSALVILASDRAESMTTEQISLKGEIPHSYLRKILQQLANAQLVNSQRGKEGGFSLAIPSHEMTILSIVDAIDPIRPITHCPLQNKSNKHNALCPLHKMLRRIAVNTRHEFETIHLADLVKPIK